MAKKNKSKELIKNTAIISFGKMCTQLVSFLLMPFYTAILTTQEYGVVDLVVTYGQLLLPVFTLQMEQSLFRFLLDVRDSDEKKHDIISDIMSITLLMSVVLSGVFLVVSLFVNTGYNYLLLANLWATLIVTMLLQISRGFGLNKVYALGSFISAAGQVALNIVFVLWLRMGATGMIAAMIISQLIAAVFVAKSIHLGKYLSFRAVKWDSIKEYVGYSAPLVPNAISWWILNASDRTIILRFLGVGFNGIYSAANKFSGIYTTLFNIFNLSWTESVALYLKDKGASEEYTDMQNKVIGLCITTANGIIFVMPFAFSILVNQKFHDSFYQIPLLVMGAFFSSMVGLISAYYVAVKNTATIARTTVFGAICNIVLNLAMITKIGLYAASISTVLAYLILFIVRTIDVKRKFNIKLNKVLFISGVAMMGIGYSTYFIDKLLVYVLAFVLYAVYAFIVNKKLIFKTVGMIKRKFLSK